MPLPPASLQWSVGATTLENFLLVADAWDQAMAPYLQPESTVLEIGCGCGRSARTLLRHPFVSRYVGFDVIAENIDWCKRFLSPASRGRGHFLHYNLHSAEYNSGGEMGASKLVFPVGDASVHLTIANSVFTHLLEPDAIHYLDEIGRTLSPHGHAMLSIHTNVPQGERFSGTEARIDISPAYFRELGEAAHLVVKRQIDEFCGQMLMIFARAE